MQPREKILAGLLAAVIGYFFVLRPVIDNWLVVPIQDRNAQIKSLESEVRSREDQEFNLLRATKNLAEWRSQSLPPEALNAQRVYQEWLTDVAEISGWQNIEIALGSRTLRGPYTGVVVTVEGSATLDEVNAFLQRVAETRLLQRIVGLDLESPSFDGNPRLTVALTAEGLALTDAESRTRLFPTAGLSAEVTPSQSTIKVDRTDGFPEAAPFRIRIDDELLKVTEVGKDGWQVERGAAGSSAAEHSADSDVELIPTRPVEPIAIKPMYPSVERLFVKARPRSGDLQIADELPPASQGKPWTTDLELQNWNTVNGTPIFKLQPGSPEGMFLDAELGKLSWTPDDDAELGEYDVPVAVYGADETTPLLETRLTVEVRQPNSPPELRISGPVSVWLGRPFTYRITAEDDDLPDDELQFELSGEDIPEGLRISASTGTLIWTPSAELSLEDVELEVTVTDDGSPPESDTATLTLRLRDDVALYTHLVGSIAQGDQRDAWIRDRTTNRLTTLHEGDKVTVADFAGIVETIEPEAIRIRSDGTLYRLGIGENFRNLKPVTESAAATSEAPGSGSSADPNPDLDGASEQDTQTQSPPEN
jgi:hypothetical protein